MIDFAKCLDGAMEGFLTYNEKLSPLELVGSIHLVAIQSRMVNTLMHIKNRHDDSQHDIDGKRAPILALDKLTKEEWRGQDDES